MQIRLYPSGFNWDALENVGKDNSETPACDESGNDVARILEGFADTEEAVIAEEDGNFDEGYADAVKDLVGDGCLGKGAGSELLSTIEKWANRATDFVQ